jgi:hypothetical protein
MMADRLSPDAVSRRLAWLASRYVPETVEEGRLRLREAARRGRTLAEAAVSRLADLRALCELTTYLHRNERRE